MDFVDTNLKKIEDCINNNTYIELETECFELKDLSTREDWNELHKTVCAFLNTNGGILVIGIKDKGNEKDKSKKRYHFTGFNYDDEPKLKEISHQYSTSDGVKQNLNTHFPTAKIRDFMGGKVAVLYVSELPDDEKYIYYKGKAYQRRLTGDHELTT